MNQETDLGHLLVVIGDIAIRIEIGIEIVEIKIAWIGIAGTGGVIDSLTIARQSFKS